MARWRLMTGHYLNVVSDDEPIVWEHKETDRNTGKTARKAFPVPLLMDPNDPADHNYPGEIIVTNAKDPAFRKDIVFLGDPTPDMMPLDQEAEEISESLASQWKHPIESLPGTIEPDELTKSMMEAFAKATGAVSTGNADSARLASLEALVKDLQAQLATKSPSSPIERRV